MNLKVFNSLALLCYFSFCNLSDYPVIENCNKYSPQQVVTNDTIAYFKSLLKDEAFYMGIKFKNLVSKIKIKPKSFLVINKPLNVNFVDQILVYFYSTSKRRDRIGHVKSPYLVVTFSSLIYADSVNSLIRLSQGNWDSRVTNFFGDKKIYNVTIEYQ